MISILVPLFGTFFLVYEFEFEVLNY